MSELPDVEAREIVCRVLESIAARGRSSDTIERHLELRDRVVGGLNELVEQWQARDSEQRQQWAREVLKRSEEHGSDPVNELSREMEDAILGWQSDREIPDENEEVEGLEALIATQGDRSLLDSLLQLANEGKKDNLLAAISQEPWRTKLAALKYGDYLRGVAEVRLEFWHLVESLFPSKPLSELEAGILKSGLLDEHAIRSRVALRLAFDFVWDLPKRVSRSLELSELALTTPVSDSQRRYFSLLRRCYVAGFFSECVILCRAIIEGQLKATYVRLGASNIHDKIKPMIAGAENLGWLTPESADRARAIVDAGNHAIHGDPDQVADVAGTVKATLTIASELQSR